MKYKICVAGYPRSGNVWLCRMLGDALNSPVMADLEDTSVYSIADEGHNRPGNFVVMQRHTKEVSGDEAAIIYMYRDPRDVAVSAMFYWGFDSIMEFLSHDTKVWKPLGPIRGWAVFMETWLDKHANHVTASTSYEKLHKNTYGELRRIILAICEVVDDEKPSVKRTKDVIERQAFSRRRTEIANAPPDKYPYGRTVQLSHMRKGVVGDWRNHFTKEEAKMVHKHWWCWLERLGYETDENWWKEVER